MRERKGSLLDAKGGEALAALRATLAQPKTPPSMPHQRDDLADAMKRRARVVPPPTKQAKAAENEQRSKGGKVWIKMSAADKAAALASLEAAAVTPAPPVPTVLAYDFGQADFHRIARLRDRLDSFIASHGAPERVSAATAVAIDRRIAVGVQMAIDPNNGFFVGLDFGTSTTKAVLRHPYRRIAFAVPVPRDLATDGLAHLWPTAIFLDKIRGSFSLCPAEGRIALTGFKSALIERKGHRICQGSGVTMEEAATAFLTLYIAQAFGALAEHQDGAAVAGLHLAVPVAALADEQGKDAFDRVTRTALRLLPDAGALTLDHVRIAALVEDEPALVPELHTELTGAIAGYCNQSRRHAGAHMIVDCGSATLDIAGFQLAEGRQWPVGIHAAQVERLGADACAVYRLHGASSAECRSAARHQEHAVYAGSRSRDPTGYSQVEGGHFAYQMILIGGGMADPIHADLFNGMEKAFQRAFQRPEIARDLACDEDSDATRLIIADGLARDPIDLREIIMPGDRTAAPPRAQPEMITKDQM
jgi:hypothetical protein